MYFMLEMFHFTIAAYIFLFEVEVSRAPTNYWAY